jgi:hypothetical protein
MTLFLLWVALSAVVGYLGPAKSVGFWGFFAFSLVFTPIVGVLSVLVAGSDVSRRAREVKSPGRQWSPRELESLRTTVWHLEQQVQQQALKLEELRSAAPRVQSVPMAASQTPVFSETPVPFSGA